MAGEKESVRKETDAETLERLERERGLRKRFLSAAAAFILVGAVTAASVCYAAFAEWKPWNPSKHPGGDYLFEDYQSFTAGLGLSTEMTPSSLFTVSPFGSGFETTADYAVYAKWDADDMKAGYDSSFVDRDNVREGGVLFEEEVAKKAKELFLAGTLPIFGMDIKSSDMQSLLIIEDTEQAAAVAEESVTTYAIESADLLAFPIGRDCLTRFEYDSESGRMRATAHRVGRDDIRRYMAASL
jgi:hypothetical protein